MNLAGYAPFREAVKDCVGIDLNWYRSTQLERRLGHLLNRWGVADLATAAQMIRTDEERAKMFRDWLTINVSEFFRNAERFEELRTVILPKLLADGQPLKIWSAGCSNGAEPYSLAIILEAMGAGPEHRILATDVDVKILESAREGKYAEAELRSVKPEWRSRYLQPAGELFQVAPAIKRRVEFKKHNLLEDPYPKDLDLILCRNVVIYFTDAAKDKVYRGFRQALKPGRVLLVGGTESLLHAADIGFKRLLPFFYEAV